MQPEKKRLEKQLRKGKEIKEMIEKKDKAQKAVQNIKQSGASFKWNYSN